LTGAIIVRGERPKTQGFLAQHKGETASQIDARKTIMREKEAMALVCEVDEIYAS